MQTENVLLDRLQNANASERDPILRSAGQPSEVVPRLVEAASAMTWVDARRAMTATEVVLQLADQYGSTVDRTRARWARGRALAHGGRFNEAVDVCNDGIRQADKVGLEIESGRLRLVLMQALAELGMLSDAINAGQTARKIFLERGEHSLAARAEINLGIANLRRDDPAAAVACFEHARPWLQDEPLVLGHLENSRGEALWALGQLAEAESAFQAAHASFEKAHASLPMAIAEGNLADLAARAGQLQKALYHFERARRQLEADDAPGQLARLLAEQAEAINNLGMPKVAASTYEKVLPQLQRCGLVYESARARAGMGVALLRLNRLSEAETSLAAAAKSFDELGNATFRARVDLVRAQLLSNSGQRALARTLALKALANLHDRLPDAIAARLFLGRLSLEERKYDQADAELASGLADAQELDIAPLKAELLMTRGLLRRKQSRLGEAIGFFTAAIEQIERVRGSLQAERFRVGYHSEQTKAYEWLLMSLLELGGDAAQAQAFAVAEQAKSRSLLDQMRQTMEDVVDQPSAVHDSAESALWKKMSQLRADLNALYSRLDDDRAHKTSTPQSWRAAVKDRERDLDELESRLRTTRGMGGLYAPTTTIEQVQNGLDADTALIEYFIAGDELLAYVVTKSGAQTFRGLANPSELASALQRLQFQVNRALRPQAVKGSRAQRLIADARHELSELYDLVWSPLRGATQHAKHLIVVPHGPLHVLPFHALWDGERYLIESHTIQYAPSASLLVHLSAQPRQAEFANPQTALVLGVADTNAPQIADEARVVGDALSNMRKKTLIGSDATVDAFCNAAPEADVIHLACHGRFAADTPMGSGLKLADRWLTVRDIYSLKLKASLVTLSGCETGVNLVTAGDELMGLLRGFFAAGAESLLVSLWRVDDAVTREFMSDFYRSLNTEAGSRRTKADIHAQTQRKFLARYQHPALWAPFILEGRE